MAQPLCEEHGAGRGGGGGNWESETTEMERGTTNPILPFLLVGLPEERLQGSETGSQVNGTREQP